MKRIGKKKKSASAKTELPPLDEAMTPGKLAAALSEAAGAEVSIERVRQIIARLPARRRRRVTLAELTACMMEELNG